MENLLSLNLSSSSFVTTLGRVDLFVLSKAVYALCRPFKSLFLGQWGVLFEMHM